MKSLAFSSFLIIVAACSEQTDLHIPEKAAERIHIELSASEEIRASQYFSDITYVALETPQDKPIGGIWKTIVNENFIGFYDEAKGSVWLFDHQGTYINEVVIPEGRGPGELINFMDITITDDQKIHALGSYKIVVYDFEGNLTEEFYFQFLIYKIAFLDKSETYLGYTDNVPNYHLNDQHSGHSLLQFDKNGAIVQSYAPIPKGREQLEFGIPKRFVRLQDKLIFMPQLDDNIYEIRNSGVMPRYFLDFGEHSIPESAYITRDNYGESGGAEFIEKELLEKNYVAFKSYFAETEEYVFLQFSAGFEPYTAFYNKQEKTTKVTAGMFVNDLNFGPAAWLLASFENKLYGTVEAYDLLRHLNNIYENDPEKYRDPRMQPLIELGHSLDDNSNPILQIATFKTGE